MSALESPSLSVNDYPNILGWRQYPLQCSHGAANSRLQRGLMVLILRWRVSTLLPSTEGIHSSVAYKTKYSSSPRSIVESSIICNIMRPVSNSIVVLFLSQILFVLANAVVQEPSTDLISNRNDISTRNTVTEVDGRWGDCVTCAAKCGLFFCTCALACNPTTPGEPWTCYVGFFSHPALHKTP